MKPFAAEREFQLLEDVFAGSPGSRTILDNPAVPLDEAARALRERTAFLPVGHRHDAEAVGEPGVSERLIFGDFHTELITIFRKSLQIHHFLRNLLFFPL